MEQVLVSGALAGWAVDVLLFPLDSLKTRQQAKNVILRGNWLRRGYAGLSTVMVGAAPGSALFFVTYEALKRLGSDSNNTSSPFVHMLAACGGEMSACAIRVPTDVIKQRLQAGQFTSVLATLRSLLALEGWSGFYRGYGSTVLREIPFTCIQFPLYEALKRACRSERKFLNESLDAISLTDEKYEFFSLSQGVQAALCGSVAGAIAAAITTPLDVIKTRIMLASPHSPGISATVQQLWQEGGWRALYKGIVPRTLWIGMGGFIFFGVYEQSMLLFNKSR